jgi:hypothetical protein
LYILGIGWYLLSPHVKRTVAPVWKEQKVVRPIFEKVSFKIIFCSVWLLIQLSGHTLAFERASCMINPKPRLQGILSPAAEPKKRSTLHTVYPGDINFVWFNQAKLFFIVCCLQFVSFSLLIYCVES